MMTVNQLIKTLETLKQDAIIVLSCDSEGNYYSPLANGLNIIKMKDLEEDSVYYNEVLLKQEDEKDIIILYPLD